MKKMILGCFLYGTAIGLYAQAPQGDFKGSIQIGLTTMPIVFHFGQQNGQPTTTMDSPAQGVFGFPVQSSECLSDGELTLKIPQIQFCYVGKVRSDSLIEGTVTQAGQSLPLNLIRTARKAGVSSEPERPGTPKPPLPLPGRRGKRHDKRRHKIIGFTDFARRGRAIPCRAPYFRQRAARPE